MYEGPFKSWQYLYLLIYLICKCIVSYVHITYKWKWKLIADLPALLPVAVISK